MNHPYRETFDQADTRIAREMRDAHEDETPMNMTNYQLPDGRIVAVDPTAAKHAPIIDFTLSDGTIVDAIRLPERRQPKPAMVTHRFQIWIDVPAVSGDGWSKYPDFSAEEIGRAIRRALFMDIDLAKAVVEHADTTPVEAK